MTSSDLAVRRNHSLPEHHAPHVAHFTFNSRGALYQLLLSLPAQAGDTILVPAFHCVALVKPIIAAGYRVAFYRVRVDLTIDLEDLESRLVPGVAAVVAIHYFGFPANLEAVLKLSRSRGVYLIEDCAHSFLSRDKGEIIGRQGDFAMYSYYKLVPSLVGGSLVLNRTQIPMAPSRPLAMRAHMRIVKRLIKQLAENSRGSLFSMMLLKLHSLFRRGGTRHRVVTGGIKSAAGGSGQAHSSFLNDTYHFDAHLGRAAMPWYARHLVATSDWEHIARKRRENYLLVSELLPDTDRIHRLWPGLPAGVVPWAYPVLLQDRIEHERALRDLGLPLFTFGERLHDELKTASAAASVDAQKLSCSLMLLPVHQLLDRAGIEAYVEVLLSYLKSEHKKWD